MSDVAAHTTPPDWTREELESEYDQAIFARNRAWENLEKLDAALREALTELERMGERDRNHDGFATEPTEPDNCRLCQAIRRAQESLNG